MQIQGHLAYNFILVTIFLFTSINSQGQNLSQSVPEQAAKDEIWLKTYQTLGIKLRTKLRATQKSGIIASLSEEFKIEEKIIRAFLRFALNYAPDISVEKVLVRYPHYNATPLREELSTSLEQGLLKHKKKKDTYRVTRKGKVLIKKYWSLKTNQAKQLKIDLNEALAVIYSTLEKITKEAGMMTDGFVNSSIRWSMENKYKAPKKALLLVSVFNPFNDLIAFVNDNAHYRFDRLVKMEPKWNSIQLGSLAKELLGAMRNGRTYMLNQCYEQPNWRQPKENCQLAIKELLNYHLIQEKDNHFTQSEKGQNYFKAAEQLTIKRLYSSWDVLDNSTYLAYKAALEQINNKLEQNL